jgi:hypothetical protein
MKNDAIITWDRESTTSMLLFKKIKIFDIIYMDKLYANSNVMVIFRLLVN